MAEGKGEVGRVRLATESIAGLRPYQEDAVITEVLPDGRTLVAVADGMGGHAAGEVASALALETLRRSLREGEPLGRAFDLANREVQARADDPDKHGMGTTLVAALLDDKSFQVANVGDSRCYVLSAAGIRQVTEDHSFVTEAIKRGQSEEEAMASQWRDALTRSIGNAPSVEVDVFGPFALEPDTALLLCSDGLYKTLRSWDIASIFLQESDPEAASRALVAAALERGSDDNISVAIAEIGQLPRNGGAGTMPLDWTPPGEEADAGNEGTSGAAGTESTEGSGSTPGSGDRARRGHVAGAEHDAPDGGAGNGSGGENPAEVRTEQASQAGGAVGPEHVSASARPEASRPFLPYRALVTAALALVLLVVVFLVVGR